MGDFWDHLFNAAGHLARANQSAPKERRPARMKKMTKGGLAPRQPASFDAAPTKQPVDPSCCITSRRTIKGG